MISLTLNGENLRLFCLSYYPDSQIALQPELLWQYDRQTVVRLFFALLEWSRPADTGGTPEAGTAPGLAAGETEGD
ncbi:hypothetical protein O5171_10705 [Escherichia coli]|nr:hypothetical protein [Escherichia coli]